MNFNPEPFDLLGGAADWAAAIGSFVGLVLLVSIVTALAVHGVAGPVYVFNRIKAGFVDACGVSPRRTWALASLTIKEAVRRKALMVFVVFAVLFMFAGWFLDDPSEHSDMQVKVYVSFVLTSITWLTVPVILLISCWGIPEDIKARSIHTVVTKPTRRIEIVIGRMLGFATVATGILVMMAVVGWFWTIRQLPDDVDLVCRVPVYVEQSLASDPNAPLDEAALKVSGFSFKDREGNLKPTGINTGDVVEFISYIEGATKARAIWQFKKFGTQYLNDKGQLRLETRFQSFRSHKGKIATQLLCQLNFTDKSTGKPVGLPAFEVAEFTQNVFELDRTITYFDADSGESKQVDLIDDLVDNDGTLRIEALAIDSGQYLGMAKSSLFIRLPDRPFAAGYFKAIFGIWLMLVLIVMLGVTASCFVKGPVATFLTLSLLIMGQGFREFMLRLTGEEKMIGGGAAESWYRLLTHMNPKQELPDTLGTDVIESIDTFLLNLLWIVKHIVPNFGNFKLSTYVANGFDVPWSAGMLPGVAMTCAYVIPCLVIGYYSLSLRELEAK